MSGLEIAGLVLGALPLAIEVLDRYSEVADRIDVFFKIKAEYDEWHRRLEFNYLLFKRNVEELLLPLMVDDITQKDNIPKLMKDPFGSWWTEPEMAHLLQKRLRDGYKVYMGCIQDIEQVMEDIVRELALGHAAVQSKIASPGEATIIASLKALRDSDNLAFQKFRFKFALKGPKKRTRLFTKLEEQNKKLQKILKGSDRVRDLSAPTAVTAQSKAVGAIDTTLCNFWVTADRFFNALASSWNCRCNTHCANLLLHHRSNAAPEFEVLFTKEQPSMTTWNVRKTKIVEKQGLNSGPGEVARSRPSLPIHTPSHKDIRPLKSALGNPKKSRGKTAMFAGLHSSTATTTTTTTTTTTVTLVEVKEEDRTTVTSTMSTQTTTTKQMIHCLCTALEAPASRGIQGDPTYGYLISENMTYHIYDIPYNQPPTQQYTPITLQDIIDGDLFPTLKRKRMQRFTMALTIASSFVQLLDSPWLPTTLTKTDIIFPRGCTSFLNDEPYVQRPLIFAGKKATHAAEEGPPPVPIGDSLDQLGIILLELCFNERIRDQKCRRDYEKRCTAPDDYVLSRFDVMAARDWQGEVLQEAGQGFADAVAWCLGGNRGSGNRGDVEKVAGKTIERWRRDMFRNVIVPLKLSCDNMAGIGVED
ncbi:hypothetical protein SMACR_07299 [Sordaria macrospora]|uniref:WGS project CABT00000000 data, contig 2.44 n=2 Tax=Sordaria macrospora TaxID=5147 RepID=F7W8E5_SORMK|nr:uncharacterized protein SMAC_07299 [Sordaria macrospora k-hell]KAA8630336.1 hypothetical protein SMACR_07299 [Sordaria macrospora]WPJ62665.1 hypothetical protein SMAC4_07299 [Sordaria macrospora]CCC13790.1 unnamed protein product [Sordaria macrospora k-hell]